MANLRAKQANGTLSEDEKLILEGETNGWPTSKPGSGSSVGTATQPCTYNPPAASDPSTAYPGSNLSALSTVTPGAALPYCGPTPIPTPRPLVRAVSSRGEDPAILPPESFEMGIKSISIEGDIARAVISKFEVAAEAVLVKVNGQWYIAGAKSLPYVSINRT